MRTIAIINQKGGVGKTTTAVNLAAALVQRRGRAVMLVDLDPQAHATLHLGIDPEADGHRSVYDVLTRGLALAEVAQYAEDRLALVPAHIDLVAAELELADTPGREYRLSQALRPHGEHFDAAIIDCAPSLGLLTVNALAAADEVIIPLQAHFFALQGLGRLLQTIELVRADINPRLRVGGVLLCMFDRGTRLAQEVAGDVSGFLAQADPGDPWYGARLFETRIRRNIKLAECPSFGQSIFAYDASSHGAEDYAAFADEVEQVARAGVVHGPVSAEAAPLVAGSGETEPERGGVDEAAALPGDVPTTPARSAGGPGGPTC